MDDAKEFDTTKHIVSLEGYSLLAYYYLISISERTIVGLRCPLFQDVVKYRAIWTSQQAALTQPSFLGWRSFRPLLRLRLALSPSSPRTKVGGHKRRHERGSFSSTT
jgi:hypothetical protein